MLRRDEQFRSAPSSRDDTGQANGILTERFGVDAVRAFELPKRLSQETGAPLHQIAKRVTTTRARRSTADSALKKLTRNGFGRGSRG
jgi:hypothetical protein